MNARSVLKGVHCVQLIIMLFAPNVNEPQIQPNISYKQDQVVFKFVQMVIGKIWGHMSVIYAKDAQHAKQMP